jgi:hypothetical protein
VWRLVLANNHKQEYPSCYLFFLKHLVSANVEAIGVRKYSSKLRQFYYFHLQEKMEEILSVMREIKELSTEHKTLSAADTTERIDTADQNQRIDTIDQNQRIDSDEFNQMLGRCRNTVSFFALAVSKVANFTELSSCWRVTVVSVFLKIVLHSMRISGGDVALL